MRLLFSSILFLSIISVSLSQTLPDANVWGNTLIKAKTANGDSLGWIKVSQIQSANSGFTWNVGGNNISVPGILGTNTAQPLILETNNVERFKIASNGDISLGSANSKIVYNPTVSVTLPAQGSRKAFLNVSQYSSTKVFLTSEENGYHETVELLITRFWNQATWEVPTIYRITYNAPLHAHGHDIGFSTDSLGNIYAEKILYSTTRILKVAKVEQLYGTCTVLDGSLINTGKGSDNSIYYDNLFYKNGTNMYLNNSFLGITNLGINTNSPTNTLDIEGTLRVRNLPSGLSTDSMVTAGATGILNKRKISDVIASGGWSLLGNSGTVGTNFIGTTDNQDLVFKTNNIERGRFTTSGEFQMGTPDISNSIGIALKPTEIFYRNASNFALSLKQSGYRWVAWNPNEGVRADFESASLYTTYIKSHANYTVGEITNGGLILGGHGYSTTPLTLKGAGVDDYSLPILVTQNSNGTLNPLVVQYNAVGIMTGYPSASLDVNGNARIRTLASGSVTDSLVTADATGILNKRTVNDVNNLKILPTILGPSSNFNNALLSAASTIYQVNNYVGAPNSPVGAYSYGALHTTNVGLMSYQMYYPHATDAIRWRAAWNGTWEPWRTVLDSQSYAGIIGNYYLKQGVNSYTNSTPISLYSSTGTSGISLGKDLGVGLSGALKYVSDAANPANAYFAFPHYGDADNAGLVLRKGGNIGIGTTTPSEKLHVAGKLKIETFDSGSINDSIVTKTATGILSQRKLSDVITNILTPARQESNFEFNIAQGAGFGQIQNRTHELGNVLWKADKRMTIGGKADASLFDGKFLDQVNISSGDSITIEMSSTTYVKGGIYLNYYYTSYPSSVPTLEIVANGGNRYYYTAIDISADPTYKLHKFQLSNNINYLTKIIIRFPSSCQLSEISYISEASSGSGTQEPPFFNKSSNINNYYGTMSFNTTGGSINNLINAQGHSYFGWQTGNLGIGTNIPAAKLEVNGTTKLSAGFGDNWLPYSDGNNYYRANNHNFADHLGNEKLRIIGSSGNVGIGTTSPSTKLDVNGSSSFRSNMNIYAPVYQSPSNAGNSYYYMGINGVNKSFWGSAGAFDGGNPDDYLIGSNSGIFNLYTAGVRRLSILQNGNIGIGTASPSSDSKVHIAGGNIGLTLSDNGLTNYYEIGRDNATTGNFKITRNGSQALDITSGGNVGIGTTTPASKLEVIGTARITTMNSGATTDSLVTVNANGDLNKRTVGAVTNWAYLNGNLTNLTSGNIILTHGSSWNDGTVLKISNYTTDYITFKPTGTQFQTPVGVNGATSSLQYPFVSNSGYTNISGQYAAAFRKADGTNIMAIESTGKVGIGTTTPSEKLHVAGKLKIETFDSGTANDSTVTIDETGVLKRRTISSLINSHFTSSNNQLIGGLGAVSTGGVASWNDISNARSGTGHTLLLGTATGGMGLNDYYYSLNFEYNLKNGTGNMTQLAIPYIGSSTSTLFFRSRYSDTWGNWYSLLTQQNADTRYLGYSATAAKANALQVTSGAALGYIGVSDVSGNFSWASPSAVLSSGNGFVQGGNTLGAIMNFGTNDAYDIRFRTGGVTKSVLTSTGFFGINVISPNYKLVVNAGVEGNPVQLIGVQKSTNPLDSSLVIGTDGVVKAVKSNVITASQFGLVGDSTSNEYLKLVDLFNYAQTVNAGKIVLEKSKVYRFDPPASANQYSNSYRLVLKDGMELDMNGSKLVQGTTDPTNSIVFIEGDNVKVSNGVFLGNNSTGTGESNMGILVNPIKNIQNVVIENCKFFNFRGDGIYTGSNNGTKVSNLNITNCYAERCYRNGISIVSAENVIIDNYVDSLSGLIGLDLEPDEAFQVMKNVSIRNSKISSFSIGSVNSRSTSQYFENITLENTLIDDSRWSTGLGSNPNRPITIMYTKGFSAKNTNIIHNNSTTDIIHLFDGAGTPSKNVKFDGLTIKDLSTSATDVIVSQLIEAETSFRNVNISTLGKQRIFYNTTAILDNFEVDTCHTFASVCNISGKRIKSLHGLSPVFYYPKKTVVDESELKGQYIIEQSTDLNNLIKISNSTLYTYPRSNQILISSNANKTRFQGQGNIINDSLIYTVNNTNNATIGTKTVVVEGQSSAFSLTLQGYENYRGNEITIIDRSNDAYSKYMNIYDATTGNTIKGNPFETNGGVAKLIYTDEWQLVSYPTTKEHQNTTTLTATTTVVNTEGWKQIASISMPGTLAGKAVTVSADFDATLFSTVDLKAGVTANGTVTVWANTTSTTSIVLTNRTLNIIVKQ